MQKCQDLTGQKFNKLLVLKQVRKHKGKTFYSRISRGWKIENALGLE